MKLFRIVLLVSTLAIFNMVYAVDYYVDPVESDDISPDPVQTESGRSKGSFKITLSGLLNSSNLTGGDRIILRRGNHGNPVVTKKHTSDVVVQAEEGASIDSLVFVGGSNWHFKGLSIADIVMDEMSNNNTIENCSFKRSTVATASAPSGRSKAGVPNTSGLRASGGIKVYGSNNTFKGLHLKSGKGIFIDYGATNNKIIGCLVEDMNSDGIHTRGNGTVIEYCTIRNTRRVNGNHNDLIQAYGSNGKIRFNLLQAYTDPKQPFVDRYVQGIGMFDGIMKNWLIEGNQIYVDHPIGIFCLGVEGFTIKNNVIRRVVAPIRKRAPPSLQVKESKGGRPSRNNIVTGNRAEALILYNSGKHKNVPIGVVANNSTGGDRRPVINPKPKAPKPKAPKPTTPKPPVSGINSVKDLSGVRTASTTIKLSWNHSGQGTIKEYRIVLGPSGTTWKKVMTVSGTSTSAILTSKHRITTAEARLQIRGILTNGSELPMSNQIVVGPLGTKSPVHPVTEPSDKTPKPPVSGINSVKDLSGVRTTSTTIKLSWNHSGQGTIKEYRIVLGPSGTTWKRVMTVSGTSTSATLTSKHRITTAEARLQIRGILTNGSELPMSNQIVVGPLGTKSPVHPVTEPGDKTPKSTAPPAVSGSSVTYQAEKADVSGARVVGDHVDYVNSRNDFIEWTVNTNAGSHRLDFRYGLNSRNRPLEIRVNGAVVASKLSFPSTGGWTIYKITSVVANLVKGSNKIRATAIGSSGCNMDALIVSPAGNTASSSQSSNIGADVTSKPSPLPTSGKPVMYKAVKASISGAKVVGGYVDYINSRNDYIEWNVNASSGSHKLDFRYALLSGNRPLEIKVNGSVVASKLSFPSSGSWSRFVNTTIIANLRNGVNTIRATATGASGANIDALIVLPVGGPGS